MDKSYIKSDKKQALLGDWFLFISILSVFFWFIYELYHTFNSEPSYRWETSFNMVGLSFGLIIITIFLIYLLKKIFRNTL